MDEANEMAMEIVTAVANKAVEKLFDGLYLCGQPRRIIKNAKAIKKAIQTLFETGYRGKLKFFVSGGDAHIEYEEQILPIMDSIAQDTLIDALMKRLNYDDICSRTVDLLDAKQQIPSPDPLDPNWMRKFSEYASHIETDDMKDIWARILAGEIEQTGTYSLRTIDAISHFGKNDAQLISKAVSFSLISQGERIMLLDENSLAYPAYGISYMDLLYLIEIGIIQTGVQTNITPNTKHQFVYNRELYLLTSGAQKRSIQIAKFTRLGFETSRLVGVSSGITDAMMLQILVPQSDDHITVHYVTANPNGLPSKYSIQPHRVLR